MNPKNIALAVPGFFVAVCGLIGIEPLSAAVGDGWTVAVIVGGFLAGIAGLVGGSFLKNDRDDA
jgi:hypothetical protein